MQFTVDNSTAQVILIPEISGYHGAIPVYVTVQGAGQVRVGDNSQVLQQQPNDGVPFTAMTNNLPDCLIWWVPGCPLYIISNVSYATGGVPCSINFPQRNLQGTRR